MPKGNNQNNLNGLNPLSYLGVNPSSPADTVFYDFDPTPTDNNFDIGTVWINTTPLLNNVWFLTSLAFGVATWILVGTFNGEVNTLTADGAVVVPPIGENINILGDGVNITTVGNAGTATINVTLNNSITLPATNVGGTSGVINIGAGIRFVSGLDLITPTPPTNAFFGANSGNLLGTLTGTNNTGIGYVALNGITTGVGNSTLGAQSGQVLTTGTDNTFIGSSSGQSFITGNNNTALGADSLNNLTGNSNNTAIGFSAMDDLLTGSNNIALGYLAGSTYMTNESNNIVIGTGGLTGDNATIKIGLTGLQTSNFIAGINGVNIGNVANVVTITNNAGGDQLGSATITAGAGISVTPGANTITIATSSAFFTWQVVAGPGPINIVKENGYISNNAGTIAYALPAVSSVGDSFAITAFNNANSWQITQGAGQQIFIGNTNTTSGAGGSLSSSAKGDVVECVCVVADLTWQVFSFNGNITVV